MYEKTVAPELCCCEAPSAPNLVEMVRNNNSLQQENLELISKIISVLFGNTDPLPTKADPNCFADDVLAGLDMAKMINNALHEMCRKIGV